MSALALVVMAVIAFVACLVWSLIDGVWDVRACAGRFAALFLVLLLPGVIHV